MKRTSREPSKPTESLHRQLNSYAFAASAAGVSALALMPPTGYLLSAGAILGGLSAFSESAEARIVYTPANTPISCVFHGTHSYCNSTVNLDLNHDKIADLKFRCFGVANFAMLGVVPRKNNEIWSINSLNVPWAAALSSGATIQSAINFRPGALRMFFFSDTGCGKFFVGPWAHVQNRYLGVRFIIKGKVHYGWARLKTYRDLRIAKLTGYAYETIPNKPIIAGKKHGTLGELAAGRK